MPNLKINRGQAFSVTVAGTTTAQPATTVGTVTYYVTDISGSSSGTAGTWVIIANLAAAGGTTVVLWQGAGAVNATFTEPITLGNTGTISFYMNGATATYGNISGFFI